MNTYGFWPKRLEWEAHLLGLSSLIAVVSIAIVWKNPNPETNSVPEVLIPLGISLGLGLYTLRLKRRDSPLGQYRSMAKFAWAGALLSGAIGAFWLALHLYYGLPIDVLPDKILTLLSLGVGTGVVVARSPSLATSHPSPPDRNQILAETTWTSHSGSSPITNAVVEALTEVEGVDPVELEPLYTHMDTDALAKIRSHDGAPWQYTVYLDDYEVRISSHGTVTVYRNDRSSA